MECGIVGLPGVGKSTLFSALTGSKLADSAGTGGKPAVGVAHIPDPRLELIASHIPTRKVVRASIQFVDIPGVPPGGAGGGASKLNAFLSHVRTVDAMCHVVRCFDDGMGPEHIDPISDIDQMDTELVLADLVVAESALDKARRSARTGDADAKARVAVLEKVVSALNDGRAIRHIKGWSDAEAGTLRSYGMITAKPVLYVANVGEDDLAGTSKAAQLVKQRAEETGSQAVILCAKLEAELAELEDDERAEMLRAMGLEEPAIGPMARAASALLGLAHFYTAGEKEVRAWTVPMRASAPEAAGAIHSDIQRGFIRAECYHVDDLVTYKSEKAIREAGRMRSEGKNYRMQDGDVVHFLFNV